MPKQSKKRKKNGPKRRKKSQKPVGVAMKRRGRPPGTKKVKQTTEKAPKGVGRSKWALAARLIVGSSAPKQAANKGDGEDSDSVSVPAMGLVDHEDVAQGKSLSEGLDPDLVDSDEDDAFLSGIPKTPQAPTAADYDQEEIMREENNDEWTPSEDDMLVYVVQRRLEKEIMEQVRRWGDHPEEGGEVPGLREAKQAAKEISKRLRGKWQSFQEQVCFHVLSVVK